MERVLFDGGGTGEKKSLRQLLGPQTLPTYEGILQEHTREPDSFAEFKNQDLHAVTTPALEFEFVFEPDPSKVYPGIHRSMVTIEKLCESPEATGAGLTLLEVACLRLYTGPMHKKYNTAINGAWTHYAKHSSHIDAPCG